MRVLKTEAAFDELLEEHGAWIDYKIVASDDDGDLAHEFVYDADGRVIALGAFNGDGFMYAVAAAEEERKEERQV